METDTKKVIYEKSTLRFYSKKLYYNNTEYSRRGGKIELITKF